MKLGTRISLVWCLVSGVYVAIMIWGTLTIQEKYMWQKRVREESKIEALIDQYILSKKDTLKKLTSSHSYWTEFRDAILKGDSLWIAENASEYLLDGYGIDAVYIYSEISGYEEVRGGVLEGDFRRVKKDLKTEAEGTNIVLIDNSIYLISWAPITDNDIEYPVGTYFIGEKIELSDLTEFLRIFSFIPVKVEMQSKDMSNKNLTLSLSDEIDLNIEYQLSEFEEKINLLFIYMMGVVVFVSLLLFGVFMKYIKRITKKMSEMIDSIGLISNGDYTHSVTLGKSDEAILLADSINKLSWSIRDKVIKIEEGYSDSLRLMIKIVEVNDKYTRGHSERVAFFAKALGMAVDYKEIDALEQGALLHDIGKIAIPQSILNKKGKLSESEYEIIKSHPEEGEKVLRVVPSFLKIKDLVLYHHERLDGSGYPKGLAGDEIPLGARIIAVADVFDAITSDRPYRKALELEEALEVIKKERGKGLDKELVDEFLIIAEEAYKKEKILASIGERSLEIHQEVRGLSVELEENII